VSTDVSEEFVASIFRVEKSASKEQQQQLASNRRHIQEHWLLVVVCRSKMLSTRNVELDGFGRKR
jgi:hypothetical protein